MGGVVLSADEVYTLCDSAQFTFSVSIERKWLYFRKTRMTTSRKVNKRFLLVCTSLRLLHELHSNLLVIFTMQQWSKNSLRGNFV